MIHKKECQLKPKKKKRKSLYHSHSLYNLYEHQTATSKCEHRPISDLMTLLALHLVLLIVLCMSLNQHGYGRSDVPSGFQVTVGIPEQYSNGYVGRAFVLETTQLSPNFKAALSVEAINGKYACSVHVFLGEVKVWNSGHSSPFYTSQKCVLELTYGGDLRLMGGPDELLGWRTGTDGQGVKRLQLLRTGNLVLMDTWNHIKWQSFNFPTDVMLWGQRLNVATRLTSFIGNSTSFYYSFEIQEDKIALYLNSYKQKYYYWEFKPPGSRNITFIQLHSGGLELFNDRARKIAKVSSQRLDNEPLRFLLLGKATGNLGLYYYSPNKGKFEVSFQALNTTCDLPLVCKQYSVCTFTNTCSCIQPLRTRIHSDCDGDYRGQFCGAKDQMEMLKLDDVDSVLRSETTTANVSKEDCANSCLADCECVAALHSASLRRCFLYELLGGVKQVEKGSGFHFFVKVPKGNNDYHGTTSNLRKWVLALIGVFDGVIVFVLIGCIGCYAIRKRRNNLPTSAPVENAT